LSIQVHPNDAWQRKRHNFGKTEMWYIMQADQDARIIDLKKTQTDEYLENLKGKTLLSILDSVNVKEGDAFF
jgi:mannose-6-phosphate isomerase